MSISLDATYSLGKNLSGVGVYSNEIMFGLAQAHETVRFQFCYRPHRFFRSLRKALPPNCSRFLLHDLWGAPPGSELFHGLNQRLPKRRPRKTVTTFHDLFVLTGEYSTAEFRARFAKQAREAAQASDLIIAVSQFTAGQVIALLGIESSRLRVIHHGVHGVECAFGQQSREKMILHVGAIQERKNVSRLVSAFESTPSDWTLVLAGSLGYGAGKTLQRIQSSPAKERIKLTGYIPAEDLEQLYSRASIFAFPSLDEGFGMPVLDAMARGIPVLTSNRSALPEVAGDAAILVDPLDGDAIQRSLNQLIYDCRLRESMTARGLAHVHSFSWPAAIAKTWNVYKELLR
ncbi:MAG: glycosyltransferase family 4 protein [Bryobacteraceae bacterium]